MTEHLDGVRLLRHGGTQNHTDIMLTFAVGVRDETLRTVGVCAALADPPVDRLALEAGVLAAEDGWATHPMAALLFNAKYGAQSAGLAWLDGPGYDGLTAEHVTAFAAKWFTAAAVLLTLPTRDAAVRPGPGHTGSAAAPRSAPN